MKKLLLLLLSALLILNTTYVIRGIFVSPYPAGDGLARWLFVGKLIHHGQLHQPTPPGELYSYRDDYPLLVPYLYHLFLYLPTFPLTLVTFFLPYLALAILLLLQAHYLHYSPAVSLFYVLPLLSLPLLEQMSGRGLIGFADHFLAVFITASLLAAQHRRHLLSVVFALLAAHTKNEGQIFSILLFLFYFRHSRLYLLNLLNLALWHTYLYVQHLSWFYFAMPGAPLTITLLFSRVPLLLKIGFNSIFNPQRFSFVTPTLIFALFSQAKPTRPQLLLFFLALIYFVVFLVTPTSLNLASHFSVAVDRLAIHLLIPLYVLTIPALLARMKHVNLPLHNSRRR